MIEEHIEKIKECYYVCKGEKKIYDCECYAPENGSCSWYLTILSDIIKYNQGKKNLTFPYIKEIIKGD